MVAKVQVVLACDRNKRKDDTYLFTGRRGGLFGDRLLGDETHTAVNVVHHRSTVRRVPALYPRSLLDNLKADIEEDFPHVLVT